MTDTPEKNNAASASPATEGSDVDRSVRHAKHEFMRPVRIEHNKQRNMFFVVYCDREKHCRHYAAQFDAKHLSFGDVLNWIARNNRVRLVINEEA